MKWYRNMYLPSLSDSSGKQWDASPNMAGDLIKGMPKTWIAVSECDLLAGEGKVFETLLREKGVEVKLREYEGGTHSILALSGMSSNSALFEFMLIEQGKCSVDEVDANVLTDWKCYGAGKTASKGHG